MRRKFIFVITGLFIFLTCFTISIRISDYFYEQRLKTNLHKIQIGMTEKEVIEILGKPTQRQIADIPGEYWCYELDSLSQILDDNPDRLGHMLLEMSSTKNGKVIKVFNFD